VDSTGSIQRNLRTISTQITTLAEFLYDQIDLKEFQLLRLIPTDILTENGCVIMADAGLNAWPLICDATWYSIEWIRLFLTNKQLIIVRYHVRLISFVFEFLENEFIVAITYSIRNGIIRRIASVINRL
jgi:hypothetical protein